MNNFLACFLSIAPLLNLTYARANITLQLGLSYDGNSECEDSPYVVLICIGEKKQKCSVYPWNTFYLQADCATNELPKMIEFVTERLDKTLIFDASIRPIGDSTYDLRPVEAVVSRSREISMASDELMFVLRFRVSYACVANYFGHLCDVYCSSDAKEYECTSSGEKICNSDYVKDNVTGECIYNKCEKMSGYCLNSGTCINHAESADNSVPMCSCLDGFDGLRCETAHKLLESKSGERNMSMETAHSAILIADNRDKEVISGAAQTHERASIGSPLSGEAFRSTNGKHIMDTLVPIASVNAISSTDTSHSQSEKALWYQVLVFTSATISVTILVCSVCLGTACYVYRLKKRSKLLRHEQFSSMGELRYIDNDSIPAYARRVSSLGLNFTQSAHRDPSMNSFSIMNRPYSSVSPTQIPDLETQIVHSNNQNHWPPLRLNGPETQPSWDYRSENPMYDCRIDPDQTMCNAIAFNQSVAARNLDIYSCRTMYKYMHPELDENVANNPHYEKNVNSLSLTRDRSRQMPACNTIDRSSFYPTNFLLENAELEKSMTRSNAYQNLIANEKKDSVGSFEPPVAFADINCSVKS